MCKEESWRHRFLRVESLYSDMTVKYNVASAELDKTKTNLADTTRLLEKHRQLVTVYHTMGACSVVGLSVYLLHAIIEDERHYPSPDL